MVELFLGYLFLILLAMRRYGTQTLKFFAISLVNVGGIFGCQLMGDMLIDDVVLSGRTGVLVNLIVTHTVTFIWLTKPWRPPRHDTIE